MERNEKKEGVNKKLKKKIQEMEKSTDLRRSKYRICRHESYKGTKK